MLRIELGRIAARNALDLATAEALAEAVRQASGPSVRSVLLCAAGDDFCVGGDIHFFDGAADSLPQRIRTLVSTLHSAVLALAALDVPVVSAVQGWCAGAGIGLACGADVVVAADNARFRSSYTGIGFTPDLGLTWLLPRLVGPMRAADLMYTNRALTAAEALDWGLVSRVVPGDELAGAALALARQLADGPARTHGLLRGLLRSAGREELRLALLAEADAVTSAATSAEGREGVAAFLQRRRPDFVAVTPPG